MLSEEQRAELTDVLTAGYVGAFESHQAWRILKALDLLHDYARGARKPAPLPVEQEDDGA